MRPLLAALAGLTCLGMGTAAVAQEALYGPQPPKGSAYVRFVNAASAPIDLRPDFLPAQRIGTAQNERVGAYYVVERVEGRSLVLDMRASGHAGHAALHAEPGGFLTIVLQQSDSGDLSATPIVDLAEFNQNRARLTFYNAAAGCAGGVLALDPGGQAVFKDVEPGASKARSVNPVTATMRASCAQEGPGAQEAITLAGMEPGSMFSVWLMAMGGHPTAFVTRDIATPYRH